MKRTFEIEFPDDCGPMWMNRDNLLMVLTQQCRNTQFTVRDVTDRSFVSAPATGGPLGPSKVQEIVDRYDEDEPLPDDFNTYDAFGGNMDDAFNSGVQRGREQLAQEIREAIK